MASEVRITVVEGTGIPVRGEDIDTDRIIPARYLKAVTFEGLGEFAFQDERVAADGSLKGHPLFFLENPPPDFKGFFHLGNRSN